MDIEQTLQLIVENQAQFVTDLQELRALTLTIASAQQEQARVQLEQARNHNDLVSVVRDIAEIARQEQEEHRRKDEENQRAHQRFEELHLEASERFNILIRMMDDWIRERRNGGTAPQNPSA